MIRACSRRFLDQSSHSSKYVEGLCTFDTLKSTIAVWMITLKTPDGRAEMRSFGTREPSGPVTTPTDRTDTFTTQTWSVRQSSGRRTGKNTQRNTRQTDINRRQVESD